MQKQAPQRIALAEFGQDLRDGEQAREKDFAVLDRRFKEMPQGADAVLDLSELEFIGYVYARETLRRCLERLIRRKYPLRSLTLSFDREDHQIFLEAVNHALAEFRLTALLRLQKNATVVPIGYLIYENPFETKKERRKKEKLLKVLALLIDRGEMYTNEIAQSLELTLQNCNYLLKELEAMRLVERSKEASPSGGPLFLNRIITH